MATISANGSKGHHKFTLEVVEKSTSTANNTSSVDFSFKLSPIQTSWNWEGWNSSISYKVTINGTEYTGTIPNYDGSSTITLKSGTLSVAHNTDGKKTISFSFSVTDSTGQTYTCGNASANGSLVLTNIPRYLSITSLEVTSITETSVVVKWAVSAPRTSTYYSFDNGTTWIGSATDGESLASDGKSGTFNILKLKANTAYNLKVKIKRTDNDLWTESGIVKFTTYNYPHCISSPDFTIGDALTLDLYNPLGRSVRVAGYSKTDGREIFNGSTNGTRLVGFNDPHSVSEQYASIPNFQSGQYTVVVVYNDTPQTRDAGNVYKIRGNEVPTLADLTYADYDSSVVAITGNNQHIVQNKSNLSVTILPATPNNGAGSIAKYVLTYNGITKEYTNTGVYLLGKIDSSSNIDVTLTAIDSRGLSASKTIKVTMLAHSKPTALVTLERLNNYEDESYLTVDGSVSSVNGKNTMAIKYRYKLSGGSYGSFVTIGDRAKQTFSLNKNNIYIFNVVVTDAFGETYDREHTLDKGVFPLFIDTGKNSVGINKLPVYEHSLEASGMISLGEANSFELQPNESKEIYIFLAGVTALVNFRVAGANLEIAKLFYVFRPTQYFGIHKTVVDESFNNTGSVVPFEIGNAENGYKFKITNNHSSSVIARYGILELC